MWYNIEKITLKCFDGIFNIKVLLQFQRMYSPFQGYVRIYTLF